MSKEEYNEEKVFHCDFCLSLAIKTIGKGNIDYCMSCGNSEVKENSFNVWESLYESMYNKKFLDNESSKQENNTINDIE